MVGLVDDSKTLQVGKEVFKLLVLPGPLGTADCVERAEAVQYEV